MEKNNTYKIKKKDQKKKGKENFRLSPGNKFSDPDPPWKPRFESNNWEQISSSKSEPPKRFNLSRAKSNSSQISSRESRLEEIQNPTRYDTIKNKIKNTGFNKPSRKHDSTSFYNQPKPKRNNLKKMFFGSVTTILVLIGCASFAVYLLKWHNVPNGPTSQPTKERQVEKFIYEESYAQQNTESNKKDKPTGDDIQAETNQPSYYWDPLPRVSRIIESKINELFRNEDIVALVYPKKIDEQSLKSRLKEIENEHLKNGKYLFSNEKEKIWKDLITDQIVTICQQQIESGLSEIIEFRKITGAPVLGDIEKFKKRSQLTEQIIDQLSIGYAGMARFNPTSEMIDAEIIKKEKKFKNVTDFQNWVDQQYGPFDRYKKWIKFQLAGNEYLIDKKENEIHVTPAEVSEYYDKNQMFFEEPERIKLAQIFIKIPSTASTKSINEKRKTMNYIIGQIKSGKDFSLLAKKYSEDESRKNAGFIGVVERGDLPDNIEKKVFQLRSGEVSQLIESKRGLHIFKALKYHPKKIQEYKNAKMEIENYLKNEKFKEYLHQHIEELRLQLEIKGNKQQFKWLEI